MVGNRRAAHGCATHRAGIVIIPNHAAKTALLLDLVKTAIIFGIINRVPILVKFSFFRARLFQQMRQFGIAPPL